MHAAHNPTRAVVAEHKPEAPGNTPAPTLDDVAGLTPESDYSAFVAAGVDERVRNEALRKLFHGDPHFQHSDGLDVSVDEVAQLAQSALARQHTLRQARALGLLDDELPEQPQPED
jgi:Protein of unknown function (DUF3306)